MIKYIKEFQNRFILVIVCWVGLFSITYLYKEILFFEMLNITVESNEFIFTDVIELLLTYLKLTFFISNQISLIYLCYSFIVFLTPGLYYYEYKFLASIFKAVIISWFISLIVLTTFFAQFTWNFFLSFQKSLTQYQFDLRFEAKISEYLVFFKEIYYCCNIQFQIFVVLIFILNYLNYVKNSYKRFRKGFYFVFLLTATFITPPDIITQLVVYTCLIIIFEITVVTKLLFKNY